MEQTPFVEKKRPISPEEFFDTKIEIYRVPKENFIKLVKEGCSETPDDDTLVRAKGVNFDKNGKVVILLRTDAFPEEYMPYIETHEKWEAYIAKKDGFNLWQKSIREYKQDKGITSFQEEDYKKFLKEIWNYNYDFRHEYAIYKEYQQAKRDGKLYEYHKWHMDTKMKEKENLNECNLKLIENDIEIRKLIYSKLTENTPHLFTRK